MTGRKYIILVGDGNGGLSPGRAVRPYSFCRPLGLRTWTPWREDAVWAWCKPIPEGLEPGSDIANLNLMGYDPQHVTTRAGRPWKPHPWGWIWAGTRRAFRCNLVTLGFRDDGIYMEDYSAGHIASDKARLVVDALNEELADDVISFHPGCELSTPDGLGKRT